MIAVAASAAVLAVLASAGVPATAGGLASASAGCLAVVAVSLRAGGGRDLASALLAVACGVAVGWPLVQDTCSPVGIFLGPAAGLLARAASKPGRHPINPAWPAPDPPTSPPGRRE